MGKNLIIISCRNVKVAALIGVLFIFFTFCSERVEAGIVVCNQVKKCKGTDTTHVLVGNKRSNNMHGLNGSDYIIGLFGNDRIVGYTGSDTLLGGAGDDIIHGGAGHDAIMGGTGNDNITGGYGADEIIGGEGNDTIRGGMGPDTIMGGEGDDFIIGGMGADEISGGNGDDKIFSSDINSTDSDNEIDIIRCGEGNDEVWAKSNIDGDQISDDCEITIK